MTAFSLSDRAAPQLYRTEYGAMLNCTVEDFLSSDDALQLAGRVSLIFTSPPFPLRRKKSYGNREGEEYLAWLSRLAEPLAQLLSDDGSIVIEIGNAWDKGEPTMSTLGLEALLEFSRKSKLKLCQQFVCDNPSRLPGPAEWVNRKRIRVKDSFTHVWWLSKTAYPKADNKRVLRPYSMSMRQLLSSKKYNSGKRPSEHSIGSTSFLAENGGSIPSNVLSFSNTASRDEYLDYCAEKGLKRHPARMPRGLAEFFVRFLTDPGDLVLDPFAGSNTTGAAAEYLDRRWLSVEADREYAEGSKGRFRERVQLELR